MKRIAIAILIGCTLTGCATTSHVGEHFSMSGTPDGIRAFSDTLVGSMKTAKESPDTQSQYFTHRADFERNVTARTVTPPRGFLQKLFGDQQQPTTENQGS